LPQTYRGQVAKISCDAAEFAVNFQAIRNAFSADAGGQGEGKNEIRLAFGLRDHLNDPLIPGRFREIKVCDEVLYFLCCCSTAGLEPFDGFIDDHLSSFAGVIGAVIEPWGAGTGKVKRYETWRASGFL